jgi:uncharacterized protein (TIGR03663 family)
LTSKPELPERDWRIAAAAILAVAAFLRLYHLGLKPLHHDEGVNGLFLLKLVRAGVYRYDPANYHGPTLYYFARLADWAGLTNASIRVAPALFGIATVGLVLCLRRQIGKRGALAAAALIAVSPGAVFYSRYFIHETLFVFFAVALAVCAWLAIAERRPNYLLPAALAAALMFATKETAVISAAALVLAAIVQRAYARSRKVDRDDSPPLGGWPRGALQAALAAFLFAAVFVLFYSSFFHNFPHGVYDALESFKIWTKTGVTQAFYPKYAYLAWSARQEWPLLLVSAVGLLSAVLGPPRAFGLLLGIWGCGLFVAYTLIPYKTPWLVLNFTIPLAIAGGYGVAREWERASGTALHVLRAAGMALLAVLLYQTIDLNFVRYDDQSQPYVYLHTTRAIDGLVRDIKAAAARSGLGEDATITIAAPEYWPLPWYLRDYHHAGYWGRIVETQAPAVVGSLAQERELEMQLGDAYRFVNSYKLRPGVTLVLFVKR